MTNAVANDGSAEFTFGPPISFDQRARPEPVLAEMPYQLNSGQRFAIEYEESHDTNLGQTTLKGTVIYEASDRSPDDVLFRRAISDRRQITRIEANDPPPRMTA